MTNETTPTESAAQDTSVSPDPQQTAAPTEAAPEAATEQVAEETANTEAASPASPAPKPAAVPKPTATPKPTPGAMPKPTPAAKAPEPEPATENVAELAARGRACGRIDESHTVFVTEGDTEREIGSYPGVSDDEALAYFVRKYDELAGQVSLVEQRLALDEPPTKEIGKSLRTLAPVLEEANVLGDVAALRERVEAAEKALADARAVAEQRRAEAKEKARAERDVIVAKAETIANQPPERTSWKSAGDSMKAIFDEWKEHQRANVKLDKLVEEELWQRFKGARSTFDRNRRTHFAALDRQHGETKAAKEELIKRAEALSSSTEWGATSAAYRDLMGEWKKTGRAGRKDDDALWERFRAAQDVFFAARNAANAEQDEEFKANLVVKEALLAEAQALLPIKNLNQAKKALRDIGTRWDAAGKVPRADVKRMEQGMQAVEQAVRQLESDKWKSSNPEVKARAEGALGQLQDTIAQLEEELAHAEASGNAKKVKKAQEALTARRAWLEQIQKAASDYS